MDEPKKPRKFPVSRALVISAISIVAVVGVGSAGFYLGYRIGQDDLRAEIRSSLETAFGGRATSGAVEAPTNPVASNDSTPVEEQQVWSVEEDKSPVDDSPTVTLSMTSAKPYRSRFGRDQNAFLVIRCRENQTDLIIGIDEFLGLHDGVRVTYRIGDQPAKTATWATSTSGKGAFASNPIQLAKELAASPYFFVRISGYSGEKYDLEFVTNGLAEALPKVQAACHWPT